MGKKSLLAQLPKRTRDEIAWIMENGDGELPLHEFLAKRWDYVNFHNAPQMPDEWNRENLAENRKGVGKHYPELKLGDDHIDWLMSFCSLNVDLKQAALARRIVLEDPAELARGWAIEARLYKLLKAHTQGYMEAPIIAQCAIRQVDEIARSVAESRPGYQAIISVGESIHFGVISILQQNWEALDVVVARPPDQTSERWVEGMYSCLVGVARRQPDMIANGLSELLIGIKNTRPMDPLVAGMNMDAHGLYRLCECVEPQLVSEFDVDQPRPWDAEFHRWCEEHPDPLADVDLTSFRRSCTTWLSSANGQIGCRAMPCQHGKSF